MPRSHSAPSRVLPDSPSLAQLRKQAKELLKSYCAGDASAVAEVQLRERDSVAARFALADAQRVLARSYGFASWTKLKQHVDGVNATTFAAAVESSDEAAVRSLAKTRPELVDMKCGGRGDMWPLHLAVLAGDADMTRVLMELGADARIGLWPHRDATSAHTIAVERGCDEIVAIIEQAEAARRRNMSAPGTPVSSADDEIHRAILERRDDDAVRMLESDLSLIGACDHYGATPLHIGAWTHQPQIVAWLLDHGAAVDAPAPHDVPPRLSSYHAGAGKTPLDYAATSAGWSAYGRDSVFLENAQVDPARFDETVSMLRSAGARLTPRVAVAIGDRQAVLQMHDAGRLDNDIHFYRGGLLSIAVRVDRVDMVSLLLDLGLHPDESAMSAEGDRSWGMPLWFAAACGRGEIARRLLAAGADVNAIVHACGDPLSVAQTTGDEEMCSLLLAHGARVTVEHVAGSGDREAARAVLAGTLAAQSLNVDDPTRTDLAEQMLWAAGSSDPEIVRICLPHMKREKDDPWWNYVLMHATLPDSFRLILDHGIDPDVAGEGGYTMLHHLATLDAHDPPGRRQITERQRLELATLLLDAGASLTRRDPLLQSTPLGWASRWGRTELAQLYLDRGADPLEPDAAPWATPTAWAAKGGHAEIVELLRNSQQ